MNMHLGDTRLLIEVGRKHGLLRNQLAYLLATAYHETAATLKPVRETLASTDAKAREILTKSWKAGKLPWVKSDYWSSGFFGRGYVQLTHKENYQKAGAKLGIDLVGNPSKALESSVAAEIIALGMKEGWFTGKKLSDYVTLQKSDFVGARKIVNGTDKADLIAGYAKQYDALLKAEGYGDAQTNPVSPPIEVAPLPTVGLIAKIIAALAAIFKGKSSEQV
ncbi:glycoside hydrolase family 19 protein [Brucella sp. 22210]|uniref:glycoside hydrolase family 19 protein n=1 Tax=Brucella sp. 22210 TaxID=3453892 RepID=UPI003F8714C7